jgi:branched-chain amino acid transport system ATP-binding protein
MLRIDGLSAGYSSRPVLSGVSIHVQAGQFVAIVGPNGAGKTTLFKTISGILKPSAGTIAFEGHDLLSTPPSRRPHLGIAHVPEGRQVFPSLTVMENLEMGAVTEAGRRDWKNNIERIFEWLPILAERRAQFAGTLSGGQQQMLAIARALLNPNRLLLIDEPTKGLAPALVSEVTSVLERVAETETVLLVEQNLRVVRRLARSIVVLDQGRVLHAGRAADLDDEALVHRLLGVGHAA